MCAYRWAGINKLKTKCAFRNLKVRKFLENLLKMLIIFVLIMIKLQFHFHNFFLSKSNSRNYCPKYIFLTLVLMGMINING